MVRSEETAAHRHPRSLAPARPLASDVCLADEPEKRQSFGFELSPFGVLRYGIGGFGTGGTPQPFHKVAHPLEFRSQVQQQIEKLH